MTSQERPFSPHLPVEDRPPNGLAKKAFSKTRYEACKRSRSRKEQIKCALVFRPAVPNSSQGLGVGLGA